MRNQKFKSIKDFKFFSFLNESFNFIDLLIIFINIIFIIIVIFSFSYLLLVSYFVALFFSLIILLKFKSIRLIVILYWWLINYFSFHSLNKKILVIEFKNFSELNLSSEDLFVTINSMKNKNIKFNFIQFNYVFETLNQSFNSKNQLKDSMYFLFYNFIDQNEIINFFSNSHFKNYFNILDFSEFKSFFDTFEDLNVINIEYFDTFENHNLVKLLKENSSLMFIDFVDFVEGKNLFSKTMLINKLNNIKNDEFEEALELFNQNKNLLKINFFIFIENINFDFKKNENLIYSSNKYKYLYLFTNLKNSYNNYSFKNNIISLFDYENSALVYDNEGLELGLNKRNFSFKIDLFKKNEFNRLNSNYLILGTSGSGKSYLLQKFFNYLLNLEKPILILDLENEYPNSQKLNIFLIFEIVNIFSLSNEEKEIYIKDILELILKEDFFEKIQLFSNQITNHSNIYEWIINHQDYFKKDFIFLLKNNFDYYQNYYIFNFKEIFDLSKTNKNIEKLFIFIYIKWINFFVDFFFNSNIESAIIIDEFHLLLNIDQKLLIFLTELIKKIRKRNSSLFISTQSLGDFFIKDSNLMLTFLNNINYFFISKLLPNDLELFSKKININSKYISVIENNQRGEFLFSIQLTQFDIIKVI